VFRVVRSSFLFLIFDTVDFLVLVVFAWLSLFLLLGITNWRFSSWCFLSSDLFHFLDLGLDRLKVDLVCSEIFFFKLSLACCLLLFSFLPSLCLFGLLIFFFFSLPFFILLPSQSTFDMLSFQLSRISPALSLSLVLFTALSCLGFPLLLFLLLGCDVVPFVLSHAFVLIFCFVLLENFGYFTIIEVVIKTDS